MKDIKSIVAKKVAEHTKIVDQISNDIQVLLQSAEKLRQLALTDASKKQDLMVASATIMTLKDRIMFHKASISALQDLISELERKQ